MKRKSDKIILFGLALSLAAFAATKSVAFWRPDDSLKKITVKATVAVKVDGVALRTNSQTPTLKLQFGDNFNKGSLKYQIGDTTPQTAAVSSTNADQDLSISQPLAAGAQSLSIEYTPEGEASPTAKGTFQITFDNQAPQIVDFYREKNTFVVKFKDTDTEAGSLAQGLIVRQKLTGGSTHAVTGTFALSSDNTTASMAPAAVTPGAYELALTAKLTDDFGKAATAITYPKTVNIPFTEPSTSVDGVAFTIDQVTGVQRLSDVAGAYYLSNKTQIALNIDGSPTGSTHVIPFVNGVAQGAITLGNAYNVTLEKEGTNQVSIAFRVGDKVSAQTAPIRVYLDTIEPRIVQAEVLSVPSSTGTSPALNLVFESSDFASDLANRTPLFEVKHQETGGFTTVTAQPNVTVNGRTIRLVYSTLPSGRFEITPTTNIADRAGNTASTSKAWYVSILPEREFGQHVEFTPYAPPKPQDIPKSGFNPGDYVETRVARLYYYRDAHRVAQIINRNIRSYNQAAVTQAERRAENSRDEADAATDTRREKERAAVRAADRTRAEEQRLAQAQQTLANAQQLNTSIKSDNIALNNLPADSDGNLSEADTAKKKDLETRIANAQASPYYVEDTANLEQQVAALEQSVATLREAELDRRDEWNDAQAKETRAKERQFRDEVTAAETDPDTYVPGDLNSVDPVTQCSISVIGEGLIQLRGPIKGINKIRTMINQIDSPVGQIKIGVFTVQINGEEGEKMEKVLGNAESNIDLSRFLVNRSLDLLRRAIQTEAAEIAAQCDLHGHYQVDRDRRYLYAFFGRDFIDELFAMDSEFLKTENKLLSLHAMDTISFNRAMFILALAKNDVRQRIISRFVVDAKTELADAEYDFRRSSELKPHRTQKFFPPWNRAHLPIKNNYKKELVVCEAVHRNAQQRYHFRNLRGFFDVGFTNPDAMNPMQREFIRLAQIFKARLVAEMEWKQRVMERALIEERSNDDNAKFAVMQRIHKKALQELEATYLTQLEANKVVQSAAQALADAFNNAESATRFDDTQVDALQEQQTKTLNQARAAIRDRGITIDSPELKSLFRKGFYAPNTPYTELESLIAASTNAVWMTEQERDFINKTAESMKETRAQFAAPKITDALKALELLKNRAPDAIGIRDRYYSFIALVEDSNVGTSQFNDAYNEFLSYLNSLETTDFVETVKSLLDQLYKAKRDSISARVAISTVNDFLEETRGDLDHRKLLDLLIDEQQDKFIELVEGTRSHISVIDQYLKRLSIAIEDDFKVQFYDPAFVRVREAARGRAVNLSQVERTTILTNNRDFAKVDPQAMMEFDLPKRQIAIKEAFDAAKALVEDTGALINDPTFLSAFQMMGGGTNPSVVKNLVPGQSQTLDQHIMGHAPPPTGQGTPGSALQSLVPEPSIFKLETGTGFQIRPVMQPDGDSCVYDFDYMYTTNIREPVRANEKHIGRIKRHFVHTAVQTGNFEVREISRYQVALKVSRTSRGVPLLEDIPIVGAAFRPAPSAESSLQQNVIFGQTNLYPTLFDLMGLRWAQQVVDLDHTALLESEHVIRGRQKSMRDYVFRVASERVDRFLDVENKAPSSYRPDFYRSQVLASPHHPSGYSYKHASPDPTGNGYERFDRRPPEMQEPPYERYRHYPAQQQRIAPMYSEEIIEPQYGAPSVLQAQPGQVNRETSIPQDAVRPSYIPRRSAPYRQRRTMPNQPSERTEPELIQPMQSLPSQIVPQVPAPPHAPVHIAPINDAPLEVEDLPQPTTGASNVRRQQWHTNQSVDRSYAIRPSAQATSPTARAMTHSSQVMRATAVQPQGRAALQSVVPASYEKMRPSVPRTKRLPPVR